MSHKASFGIQTAGEFFDKVVLPQSDEFFGDNISERHAITSIIVVYHMYEWVNKKKYSSIDFDQRYPGENEICEYFEIARNISNSNKHFKPNLVTRRQEGFDSGFGFGFERPLVIIRDNSSEISVDELLDSLIRFWKKQRAAGQF